MGTLLAHFPFLNFVAPCWVQLVTSITQRSFTSLTIFHGHAGFLSIMAFPMMRLILSMHQENHFLTHTFPGLQAISQGISGTLSCPVMPCDALWCLVMPCNTAGTVWYTIVRVHEIPQVLHQYIHCGFYLLFHILYCHIVYLYCIVTKVLN